MVLKERRIRKALSIGILICIMFNCFSSVVVSAEQTKRVALTFDDGPHPQATEKILDLLDKYSVKATFFVIGFNAQQWPHIVEKEISQGHQVGNHTYYHKHANASNRKALENDVGMTESFLCGELGYKTGIFRPPEGLCNEVVRSVAGQMNYSIILWDIDTRDWAHTSTEKMVANVKSNVKNGDIILFHDYVVGKSNTLEALEIIIPWLIEEGYSLVTVSEL